MAPARTIHCTDGVAWLREQTFGAEHAVITSLPDVSELGLPFEAWREWFSDTAQLICERLAPTGVALFFQTDIKRDGRWVDKGYLVQRGAERAGSFQLFHKAVCRAPAGMTTFGRPAWAHLLAFSRELRVEPGESTADVLPKLGEMPWARAMGVEACEVAVRFAKETAEARVIVDPFCGLGTVLAVANRHGLDGVGVELSRKRAEKAKTLEVKPAGR
ncbi:MAG: SAM-dependent methyltransferase [Myxococcales bacterium]|nr:SAM-dependent methyltransferase [Myxococcales bacterium]